MTNSNLSIKQKRYTFLLFYLNSAPFYRSFATKKSLLSTKTKVTFLNDVCLTANDDAYANDVSFGNDVGFA